jgi:hypothetical protein
MKLILGLFLASAIAAVASNEGYERYKDWSLHHRGSVDPLDWKYQHNASLRLGPGKRVIEQVILGMSDGETLNVKGRDVTRQGETWTVDGHTFHDDKSAANYL